MQTKLSIFCTKIIEAGWLAAIVAVPLFFNIYTARTFEPDKLTLMRSIVTVMILAWFIKIIEEGVGTTNNQPFGERFKLWLKRPLILPSLAILLAYVISTAFSISPMVSLWGSYQRMQGGYTFVSYVIIFALMSMTIDSRDQVDRFVTIVIISSVPVALYGIIQRNGLDPLPWAGDVVKRVASNMGNAIFVASYLIMIVPLTVSRLIKSMKAIITEESASWGHTVLSAVYIFVLAIQLLTIVYSGSRGPQIGLLGAFALMGMLLLLLMRQNAKDKSALTFSEIGLGILLVLGVGLGAGLIGALGYGIGLGIEAMLASFSLQIEGAPLLGAALGGVIGFIGVYTYMAASGTGWRWVWISWPVLGGLALTFIILLNNPIGPLAPYLEPLKSVPYLSRLGQITDAEGGTGKVRVLIWEGVLNLISPHEALGIPGEYTDSFNFARPIIGYGPESMFNAFAFAYPPDLAHHEARGSSADRSHNETMDSLAMTGIFGFFAFYFLMTSLFYYAIKWLGWVSTRRASQVLIGLMVLCGVIGAVIPYATRGDFTLSAVGLPFGIFAGLFIYLCGRALILQPDNNHNGTNIVNHPFLLIGLLGAFLGHFLEVHFVFSIAATYTYFWAYLGVLVALAKLSDIKTKDELIVIENEEADETDETTPIKNKRRRKNQRGRTSRRPVVATGGLTGGGWETWLGSLGLTTAFILIILTFDFVPIQFKISTGRYSLVWMTSITYAVSLAIALSDTAIKADRWQSPIRWPWAMVVYGVTSIGYAGFYIFIHSVQRGFLTSGRISDIMDAANGLVGILNGFYIALFLLMAVIALILMQKKATGLPIWQPSNVWLYVPLIFAAVLIIVFKNINVVKADIYLKEGERYRNSRQWDNAITLHEAAIAVDSDEDFYYLMLALDYQLRAQDRNLAQEERNASWIKGEEIALTARNLNRFNPDNTGNMGRYYFTLGQVLDKSYYEKAIDYFEKVIHLAPQNVQYYNLLAQVYYMQGQYEKTLDWLNQSIEIDSLYEPTWLQLGDTYAAQAKPEEALEAHKEAILINPAAFADENFDNRLNFHISNEQTEDIVATFNNYIEQNSGNNPRVIQANNRVLWAIGHTYLRTRELEEATTYLQRAVDNGYNNVNALIELGDTYLALEKYPEAEAVYKKALENKNSNKPQIYSSLGFGYAQMGRIPDAIEANLKVLESLPNDYDSHKNLAILYEQAGQTDSALQHARKALEVAPDENKGELQAYIAQLEGTTP